MGHSDRCPVCGRDYLFDIPQRLDTFSVEALYRHKHYGRIYFHPLDQD